MSMTHAVIGSADQIQRVATLLGKAALRWRRERESSEIDSESLPDRLEFRSVSSLSVTGRNDRAKSQEKFGGSVETGSRHETGDTNAVRTTTGQDRDVDRRSDPPNQSEGDQTRSGGEERHANRQTSGGRR
ncbi:hypothetical protein N9N28_11500 [Rubripirellula amarantea]|nr:hypothetical protein [Rubripirellula amarantea]